MDRIARRRIGFALLLALLLGVCTSHLQEARGPWIGGGAVVSSADEGAGGDVAVPPGPSLDRLVERQSASTLALLATPPAAPRAFSPHSARSVPSGTDAPAGHLALLTNVLLLDGGWGSAYRSVRVPLEPPNVADAMGSRPATVPDVRSS